MKKIKLNFCLLLVLGLTTTVLFSCGNEEPSDSSFIIHAVNVTDGTSNIVTVKVNMFWQNDSDYGYDVIAQCDYENNCFLLKLPPIIDEKYLQPIINDMPDGITISDETAKISGIEGIYAFDVNDYEIGEMSRYSPDGVTSETWVYTNKTLTINGEVREVDYNTVFLATFNNLQIIKGWNSFYISTTQSFNPSTGITTYSEKISSQKPLGVTLKWYFNGYNPMMAVPTKSPKSFLFKKH